MMPEDLALATTAPVSQLTSKFMADPQTLSWAAEQGFVNIDFYFGGRLGVLGDTRPEVVAAAMTFFNPEVVHPAWEGAGKVMSREAAAAAFAGHAYRWADEHLPDDAIDWARLAELAGAIVNAAFPSAAPIFAGWRELEVPANDKHRAVHHLNGLRELRMARHGAAVVAKGIDVADAVMHSTPWVIGVYGWPEHDVPADVVTRWEEAEALTNQATGLDYAVLQGRDSNDFAHLANAALNAIT